MTHETVTDREWRDGDDSALFDEGYEAGRASVMLDGTTTITQSGLVIECPLHEGAFDCNSFCPNCEGEQETAVTDIWTALENPPAGCEAVARLYSWGYNEDTEKTFSVFLDLTGISSEMGIWYLSEMRPVGFLECGYLGAALIEFANRPNDVRAYVSALIELETGK